MSKWAWSRGWLRRLAAVAAAALAWSAAQPASATSVGSPSRRPEPRASPLFVRSVRAALTRELSTLAGCASLGLRRKGTVRLMQEAPVGPPEAVVTLAGPGCLSTAEGTACLPATLAGIGCLVATADAGCLITTGGAECLPATSYGPLCEIPKAETAYGVCLITAGGAQCPPVTSVGTLCPSTLAGAECAIITSQVGTGCFVVTAEPVCRPTTAGAECVGVTSQGADCVQATLAGPGCLVVTAVPGRPATTGPECEPTSQAACLTPLTAQGTPCIATLVGETCPAIPTVSAAICIPPTVGGTCATVAECPVPVVPRAVPVYTVGCLGPVGPEWLLHLRATEPERIGELSPTPGAAASAVPLGSAQWMVNLGGPIVGSPYRWRFFLRSLTQQAGEVKARLLWQKPVAGVPPKELAAWAVSDVRPWSRDEPVEAYIKEGIATGLGLLDAAPGDQVILELIAPAGADGKPTAEIVVDAPDGAPGDSFVAMTTGPPVVLAVEPASAEIPVGKGQAFRAVVRVGDAPPIERVVVQWALRPRDAPASISPEGVVTPAGEGEFQVVAMYQGMLARADVTAVKPPAVTGDVNGDGRLSIGDVILTLRAVVNLVTLDPQAAQAADVNRNGRLDIGDAVSLLRRVVGLA